MPQIPQLHTERLLLRSWRESDLPLFAQMHVDPEVTCHFPAQLSPKESRAFVARIQRHFGDHGFGLWAVEVPYVAPFIGCIGLWTPSFDAHFTPCVEISWRLTREHWAQGYATEGARAALRFGFDELGVEEVVAYSVSGNEASMRVMDKLGMHFDPADDFDHPRLPHGHPMRRQRLFRMARADWLGVRHSRPRAVG